MRSKVKDIASKEQTKEDNACAFDEDMSFSIFVEGLLVHGRVKEGKENVNFQKHPSCLQLSADSRMTSIPITDCYFCSGAFYLHP